MLYDDQESRDDADAERRAKTLRRAGRLVEALPDLTRVAGGVRKWDADADAPGVIARFGAATADNNIVDKDDNRGGGSSGGGDEWRAVLEEGTNLLRYVHTATGRVVNFRPPGANVVVERLEHHAAPPTSGASGARAKSHKGAGTGAGAGGHTGARGSVNASEPPSLFDAGDDNDDEAPDSEDEEKRDARAAAAAAATAEREAAATRCDLCAQALIEPLRLTRCRHVLCAVCVEATVVYSRHCPVCGDHAEAAGKVKRRSSLPESDADELRRRTAARVAALSAPLAADDADADVDTGAGAASEAHNVREQLSRLRAAREQRAKARRLVLEYGNTAHENGAKTVYVSFARVVRAEGCNDLPKEVIAKIDFNINPGYDKPTESVREPNGKGGVFEFRYAMARTFPCVTTVTFKPEVGVPPLVLEYVVQRPPGSNTAVQKCVRRIVLQLPPKGTRAQNKRTTFAAHPPRDGWLRFDGRKPKTTYHTEPSAKFDDDTFDFD